MRLASRLKTMVALLGAALVAAGAATAGGYHVEYAFAGDPDGAAPDTVLTKFAGKYYGASPLGGASDEGALYVFDPKTGAETVLYAFQGGVDGYSPAGALINVGGKFYGTTASGGAAAFGTLYAFDPATNTKTIVHSFEGGPDGAAPSAGLIEVGGLLYGTTLLGGSTPCAFTCGTVYSFDPTTGAETVLYVFHGGNDGQNPQSELIEVGGKLYGTTENGGSQGSGGTVYSIDPATGAEAVVHGFKNGRDGRISTAGLVELGGKLYGTTYKGGVGCSGAGCGTVFSVDPATGARKTVYAFQGGADGRTPLASLIAVDGALYGSTFDGGRGDGVVFSLDPSTRVETVLHAFRGGADGKGPQAALLSDGKRLWGATSEGGGSQACSGGCGTLFSLKP